jgi:hypothetical protein
VSICHINEFVLYYQEKPFVLGTLTVLVAALKYFQDQHNQEIQTTTRREGEGRREGGREGGRDPVECGRVLGGREEEERKGGGGVGK